MQESIITRACIKMQTVNCGFQDDYALQYQFAGPTASLNAEYKTTEMGCQFSWSRLLITVSAWMIWRNDWLYSFLNISAALPRSPAFNLSMMSAPNW